MRCTKQGGIGTFGDATDKTLMPRYFFKTRIGNTLIDDPEGEVLDDPDHAWRVARATIRSILAEETRTDLLSATLEVTDSAGEIVLEFPFSEALIDDDATDAGDPPPVKH